MADDKQQFDSRDGYDPDWTRNEGLSDYLWIQLRRIQGEPIMGPSCRNCGYCILHLNHSICPECGSDLSQVGVIDPNLVSPWFSYLIALAVWSTIALIGFLLQSQILYHVAPETHYFDWHYNYFICSSYDESLAGYDKYVKQGSVSHEFAMVGDTLVWPFLDPELPMILYFQKGPRKQDSLMVDSKDAAPGSICVTLYTYSLKYTVASCDSPLQVIEKGILESPDDMLRWMSLAGIAIDDTGPRSAAKDLFIRFDGLRNQPLGNIDSVLLQFDEYIDPLENPRFTGVGEGGLRRGSSRCFQNIPLTNRLNRLASWARPTYKVSVISVCLVGLLITSWRIRIRSQCRLCS